ncbi:integrase [Philodulcilactobacillus myokoensis]|uniref:Integrase n=1 Tax=Philodulcilactobacillus myokoensis TaxID=2929573 RepID=A0A9W6B102_9LACO|nr:phage integrase N-terminal SAM-like domain-containing protein [Philodulcilactobacillus myokoensis]GLB46885.1 integrase [Philodulcilactobacillus myokoensis]
MTTNQYPYQKNFELYLNQQHLAQITIDEYSNTMADLFNYLSNFNVGYQRNHHVNQLFDRDIEQYMQMLVIKRKITNTTYNKILSHINNYFKYLFTHQFTDKLPTLNLKGKNRKKPERITIKWITNLQTILEDSNIHPYTKLTLLLISKGYSVKEFLQPKFYHELKLTKWNQYEEKFLNQFKNFIIPIQQKQNSRDIFLKQRFSNDPHITLPGLHKYLKPDAEYLGISLSPSKLFQSYIIYFILHHPKFDHNQLSSKLNLDATSVIYYQHLAEKFM